jgi:hypothetical protein
VVQKHFANAVSAAAAKNQQRSHHQGTKVTKNTKKDKKLAGHFFAAFALLCGLCVRILFSGFPPWFNRVCEAAHPAQT